jgi:predicted anti-sigma-YlaC factor YlaD
MSMTCEQLLSYLSDYIDHELDEELAADAHEHMATCQNCRVVLDTTQQTIFLFREQGRRVIPAGRRERLFSRLHDAFQRRNLISG